MISKSYPYLAISRKYGIPYGDVLAFADADTHDRVPNQPFEMPDDSAVSNIFDAVDHFNAVRTGKIHWQAT